ncbi:MAG: metallophosphoesterase [Deltaproteobacteria bacterium]|nr:metallophosphoesterase [Deltaproteobacteria bacterium]
MSSNTNKQTKICHFSDLHLPLARPVPPWRLLGKRVLGWANLRFNRGKTFHLAAFESLVGRLVEEDADLSVMTGDLTSLAFEFEFEEVDRILRKVGLDSQKTVVVPGNHDRYAISADFRCAFERGMSDWLPEGFSRERGYPFVRIVGSVALVGLDTAVWRNPARAAGYIGRDQVDRLVALLDSEEFLGKWPVIAMHHPPFHLRTAHLRDYRSGLDGVDYLVRALGDRAATIVHGHLHVTARRRIGNLDVIGVASGSNDAGSPARQLAYHIYTFDSSGLKKAEGMRHWPGRQHEDENFERFELPTEAPAD